MRRISIIYSLLIVLTACASPGVVETQQTTTLTPYFEPIDTTIPAATNTIIPSKTPPPTSTVTPSITPSHTPLPTTTFTPSVTPTSPTSTPKGYIPQIFIGLEKGALWVNSCGDTFTYISQDHDGGASGYEEFWDHYGIPKPPGYQVRSKDGRRILDVCTKFGYGIWWAMGDGKVVENKPGVISIQIISGEAQGKVVTIQHAKSQVNLGSTVKFGDPIGTVDVLPKKPNSPAVVTAIGVLKNYEYDSQQEMMLIGIDGFPNLVYAEYFDNRPDLSTIHAVHQEQKLPEHIKD